MGRVGGASLFDPHAEFRKRKYKVDYMCDGWPKQDHLEQSYEMVKLTAP